jgi:predicted HicB family RNase H-like nuclease
VTWRGTSGRSARTSPMQIGDSGTSNATVGESDSIDLRPNPCQIWNSSMTNYKGYIGQFEVDTETDLIRGKVINTRDLITFHGSTVNEAQQAFRDSVDDYLEFCASLGEAPEKPYSGKLLVGPINDLESVSINKTAARLVAGRSTA